MPALILLVSSDPSARHRTDVLLSEAGHLVASASSLQQAKRLLGTVYPDLVIADVRLDAFNGLHIALRCRTDHPLLPVIITHDADFGAQLAGRAVFFERGKILADGPYDEVIRRFDWRA